MPYKPSRYNCIKTGRKIAVYNSFSGSLVVLEPREYAKLLHIQDCDTIDDEIRDWLRLGLIVEADRKEEAIVDYCRYRDTFLKNKPVYRILTTSECNARCFYCYERGRPTQAMSQETADETAQFIIRHAESAERLTMNWFGGEPLLNPDVITRITQKVTAALRDKEITSTLITNASLFTKELIDVAKNVWNLSNIQVSLDGLAKKHEQRKAYVNHGCSFEKTMETIGQLLATGFRVSLRLNYDKDNSDDIVNLVYVIRENFGNPPKLSCYAYPLFNTHSGNGHLFVSDKEIDMYEPRMKKALVDCGYYNPLKTPPRRTHSCFATDPYSYVINTDGLLYKCTMDMSDKNRAVGSVRDDVKMDSPIIEWTTPVLPMQCHDCKLLPICQGGCRVGRLLNIEMNDCSIKWQSIEYMLNHLLYSDTQ